MSGIGVGFFYVPLLVQFLINAYGWRGAYLGLSAVIVLIAMPLIALVMRDTPAAMNLKVDGDRQRTASNEYLKYGLESREAVRQPAFWILMVAFICISFVLNGVISHLVPMLTDRGTSATLAATVASAVGITVFVGRVGVGLLVDRIFAPRVAVVIFGMSTIGLLSFGLGAEGVLAFVAAMFVGLSLGAELDLLAYLVSRYFGLRSFAAVYGFLLSGIVVSAGLAPLSFGLWFDHSESYIGILLISAALNLITVMLMALLKPYPRWT